VTSRQNVVRIKEVAIGQLKIGRITTPKASKPSRPVNVQKLRREVRELAHQLRIIRREVLAEEQRLQSEINQLQAQDANLQAQIASLQTQIDSGVTPNPALQSFLQSKQGQTVTVSTPAGNVTGVVILVGTDAVEIRESNGDIVIIPFSKITAVQ
jgi:uncharacterized protein YlxW (UPF0749 family)